MSDNSSSIKFDLYIENACIIDGSGKNGFSGAVGVCCDKITYIGPSLPCETKEKIDAKGYILSPGFIDIHGHSDFSILLNPDAISRLNQGVTTEVTGNCGLSSAPLFGEAWRRWNERYAKKNLSVDWHEPEEYFRRLIDCGTGINIVPLLGHTNLRTCIAGYNDVKFEEPEFEQICDITSKYLQSGYWGISLGLAYPPGIFADEKELRAILAQLKKHNALLAVHLRNESDLVEESLLEILKVNLDYDVPLQISHLKAFGKKNSYKVDNLLSMIEEYSQKSRSGIHFDRYPYTAFCTDLDFILPQNLFEGGYAKALERLKDKKIINETVEYLKTKFSIDDASAIHISSTSASKNSFLGKSLTDIVDRRDPDFWLKIINFLIEINFEADAVFFLMDKNNLRKIISHPFAIIGSDSSVKSYVEPGKPHPRVYGTFPEFLRLVIDEKIMAIEEAVYKITFAPAKKLCLEKRGLIKENYYADLVLWNPDQINGVASFTEPKVKPRGIIKVWVNGKDSLKMEQEKFSGRLLLRGKD